jgi:hypothetical protein
MWQIVPFHTDALRLNVCSRRGEGYITLIVLLLPFFITITVLVFNGLGAVVAQRRAQGLATLGIQVGSTEIVFDGSAARLASDACAKALAAIQVNGGSDVKAECASDGRTMRIRVGVKAPQLVSPLFPHLDYAAAVVRGGPIYGINAGE